MNHSTTPNPEKPHNPYATKSECETLFGPFRYSYDASPDSIFKMLEWATRMKATSFIQTMLDRGLPVNIEYEHPNDREQKFTLIDLCIQFNNEEIFERILPEVNLNAYRSNGRTILSLCASWQRLELFELTLRHKVDPFMPDKEGQTIFKHILPLPNSFDYLNAVFKSPNFSNQKMHDFVWRENLPVTLFQAVFLHYSVTYKQPHIRNNCKFFINYFPLEDLVLFKNEIKDLKDNQKFLPDNSEPYNVIMQQLDSTIEKSKIEQILVEEPNKSNPDNGRFKI